MQHLSSLPFSVAYYLAAAFKQISWISLVTYFFYDAFIYYESGPQFHHLRQILGIGLCISRGTAVVLNLCCALILLPLCKKLNLILYRVLAKICPGLFFFWLEKAKSFHMTVAVTLLVFAAIHSVSHFVNLWNFSRGYDERFIEINLANYKNESPLLLLRSLAGITGVSMLFITVSMGLTSARIVRRSNYNVFWYTHRFYLIFMVLFVIHPLSGVLKQVVFDKDNMESNTSEDKWNTTSAVGLKFVSIKSNTWLWMTVPLTCFCCDHLWRIFSRNLAKVDILQVRHMFGRTISLSMSCPRPFSCLMGQYVLLQCLDVSLIEWHPFTVVEVSTSSQKYFVVWIRVKGDWTESFERILLQRKHCEISILVDGPFSSPTEGASRSDVAMCVAAGVGITPFVSMIHSMLLNPRGRSPGRLHLIWIVRYEEEIRWLADLANKTMLELRNANRPDRLHIEFYITRVPSVKNASHMVIVNENGTSHLIDKNIDDEIATLLTPNRHRKAIDNDKSCIRINKHIFKKINNDSTYNNYCNHKLNTDVIKMSKDEKISLLTPNRKRRVSEIMKNGDKDFVKEISDKLSFKTHHETYNDNFEKIDKKVENNNVSRDYPLLGCRIRKGRPHWDRVFGYWAFLYPRKRLNVFCCGPKELVRLLKSKCEYVSTSTKTKFILIHEGFS